MKQQNRCRPGYVLMMTLLLMAIAALALVQVSRTSLLRSMHAQVALEELQRRWGALSCQAVVLPNAEARLARLTEQSGDTVTTQRLTVTLGEHDFDLVIADEQAKANVNALYQRRGRETTEGSIRDLVRQSGNALTVRLKPLPQRGDAEAARSPQQTTLGSFGQVFANTSPDRLVTPGDRGVAPCDFLTCWGDGKLNIRRASQPTLKQMCEGLLTDNQISELISVRLASPGFDSEALLNQLALPKGKRDQLSELFTNESSCHSLWIVARDGGRSWYRLAVLETTAEGGPPGRTHTYTW